MPRYFYNINLKFSLDKDNSDEADRKINKILWELIESTPHVSGGLIEKVE